MIMQTFKKEIVKNGVTYTRIYEIWANGGRIFTASKQTSNEQTSNEQASKDRHVTTDEQ